MFLTKNNFSIILFVAGMFLWSCKKDNNDSEVTTPAPISCSPVSGYTGRDNTGQQTGITDITDWRVDDNWNECEKNLFGGTSFNSNCTFSDTSLHGAIGYPNPTSDMFSIDFFSLNGHAIDTTGLYNDSTYAVELVIMNQHAQKYGPVYTNTLNIISTIFSLNQIDSVMTDTIFRVYYKITDINNCVRLGHGDIIRGQ